MDISHIISKIVFFMLARSTWGFPKGPFPDSFVPASCRKKFVHECEQRISQKNLATLCVIPEHFHN